MLDALEHSLAALMMRVRVNELRPAVVDQRAVMMKTRRRGASLVIMAGNVFLGLSGSGVRMFVRSRCWIEWEMDCMRLVNSDAFAPWAGSGRCVVLPKLEGMSLRQLVGRGECGAAAMAAAGREIFRAHQLACPRIGATWSHGDLHLDNVLYDAVAGRAYLIDFDTRHVVGRSAVERHAHDLLVLLLELFAASEGWRPLAGALLDQYQDVAVLRYLAERLRIPRGLARILFHTRTGGMATTAMEARLCELRGLVQQLIRTCGAALDRGC